MRLLPKWFSRKLTIEEKKQLLEEIKVYLQKIKERIEQNCQMIETRGRDVYNKVRKFRIPSPTTPLLESEHYNFLKTIAEETRKKIFFLTNNIPKKEIESVGILTTLIVKANQDLEKKQFTDFFMKIETMIEEIDNLLK